MTFQELQLLIDNYNIDGWLLYDFRQSNPIAWKVAAIPPSTHCTRKWAIFIPRTGTPTVLVSSIESHTVSSLESHATILTYSTMDDWRNSLTSILMGSKTIAMEYSPDCDIPVVSYVDAGTVEWIRSLNISVVSSADIAQHAQAKWTQKQIDENGITSKKLYGAMFEAEEFLRHKLKRGHFVTEFDVQQHIMRYFQENDLTTYSEPIVAIDKNAANPHYSPTPEHNSPIALGNTILIDMWAKQLSTDSTYSDITWMFYAGSEIPERFQSIFSIIRDGRDAALELVFDRFQSGNAVYGYEIDDACRTVITERGYSQYFTHRTGHNIGEETHGSGANIDNYETHDTRRILAGTSFSIEPGIYIPNDIGMRTEINVVITHDGIVTVPISPIQTEIIRLV